MNSKEMKEFFKKTFDAVSSGYDNRAMRFFTEAANHLADKLNLCGDEKILDTATGTGWVASALAKKLPRGQVTAIDLSEGMLAQARQKVQALGLKNVEFFSMDMTEMDFPDNRFDAATGAFCIFFINDMERQLAHMASKIKPGGKVAVTTFYDTAFSPLDDAFLSLAESYGAEFPTKAWKKTATPEQCVTLFEKAGLKEASCEKRDQGYYLESPEQWWQIVWNGGFRGLVEQIPPEQRETFRREHLEEIKKFSTDKGLWLEMPVLYTVGIKP